MGVCSAGADAALLNMGIERHGKVVILNAEDPEVILARRLHSIGSHLDEEIRQEVSETLVIEPLFGKGCDIMDSKWMDAVLRISKGARLVIFDTFSRWHRLEENDNGEMAQSVGAYEKIASINNVGCLFLHHVNKSSALDSRQSEQQATRGAGAITDNVRWQGFMQTMSPEQASQFGIESDFRKSYVTLGGNKENYGQATQDKWLRRHEGGVLLPEDLAGAGIKRRGRLAVVQGGKDDF